jgi:hypothetical protein
MYEVDREAEMDENNNGNNNGENEENNEENELTSIDDLYEYSITQHLKESNEEHFNTMLEDLRVELKDPDLCAGVNHEPQLQKATFIMILNGKDRAGIEPFLLGFATMHFKDKILYLDLLCGNKNYKGVGTALIEAIKEYGSEHEFTKIRLNSVPKAYGFYYKMEFIPDGRIIHMHFTLNGNSNNNNSTNSNSSNSNTNNSNTNSNNTNRKSYKNKKGGRRRKTRRSKAA